MLTRIACLSALASYAAAHGVITIIQGGNGLTGSGMAVDPTTPRDGVTAVPYQRDTSIIRDSEILVGRVGPCGRTKQRGAVDIEAELAAATKAGLASCSPNGEIKMTLHQVNQDGGGPYTCDVSADGGKSFQPATVLSNIPGIPLLGLSLAAAKDFPLNVQMPQGMKCAAGPNGDACIVRCRNTTPAGPFGSCVVFTDVQRPAQPDAGNGSQQLQTKQPSAPSTCTKCATNSAVPVTAPANGAPSANKPQGSVAIAESGASSSASSSAHASADASAENGSLQHPPQAKEPSTPDVAVAAPCTKCSAQPPQPKEPLPAPVGTTCTTCSANSVVPATTPATDAPSIETPQGSMIGNIASGVVGHLKDKAALLVPPIIPDAVSAVSNLASGEKPQFNPQGLTPSGVIGAIPHLAADAVPPIIPEAAAIVLDAGAKVLTTAGGLVGLGRSVPIEKRVGFVPPIISDAMSATSGEGPKLNPQGLTPDGILGAIPNLAADSVPPVIPEAAAIILDKGAKAFGLGRKRALKGPEEFAEDDARDAELESKVIAYLNKDRAAIQSKRMIVSRIAGPLSGRLI